MDVLINVLEKYGVWSLLLLVGIYILLNSNISLQYPRSLKNKNNC